MKIETVAEASSSSWSHVYVTMVGFSLLVMAAGVLIIGLIRRCADGRIGRNLIAGLRTKATMSSDHSWVLAHEAARPLAELGGKIAILSGPLASVLGLIVGRQDPDRAEMWFQTMLTAATIVWLGVLLAGGLNGQRAAEDSRPSFS